MQDQENKKSEGQAGPWKVANANENNEDSNDTDNDASNAAVEAGKSEEVKEPAKDEKAEAKPAAYVPPSMRNRMAASSSSSAGGGFTQLQPTTLSAALRKARAPAIESQQEFPSLGMEASSSSSASIDSNKPWKSSRR